MIKIQDLLYVCRTPAIKAKIYDLENSPVSYILIENFSVENSLKEIEIVRTGWNKILLNYIKILDGKSMPTGIDYDKWQYTFQREGRPISASVWAEKYGIPEAELFLKQLDNTEKAILYLLKKYLKKHKI